MRGDSSVRSPVSNMAIGDVMWRPVTAMLVTCGMFAVAWPSWCSSDALTVVPPPHTQTHAPYICSQDHFAAFLPPWESEYQEPQVYNFILAHRRMHTVDLMENSPFMFLTFKTDEMYLY